MDFGLDLVSDMFLFLVTHVALIIIQKILDKCELNFKISLMQSVIFFHLLKPDLDDDGKDLVELDEHITI